MRRVVEHFDEIVVETLEDHSLEDPAELAAGQIAGMDLQVVCMDVGGLLLEIDDEFDPARPGFPDVEGEERMRVLLQFLPHGSQRVGVPVHLRQE